MDFLPASSSLTSQPTASAYTSAGTTQVSSTSSTNKPSQNLILLFPTSTRKRKWQPPPVTASALSPTRQKKTKTIIDCPVALTLLKGLGLDKTFFNSGTTLVWALEPTDPVILRINDYVYQGQRQIPGKLPAPFGAKVLKILRIMSNVDSFQNSDIISDFNDEPRNMGELRKMLWYGTPSANVPKILQNGIGLLKVDRPMFGDGIYFADRVDVSLTFCHKLGRKPENWCAAGNKAYLFLCDVLLGNEIYKTTTTGTSVFNMHSYTTGGRIKLNWPRQPTKLAKSVQGLGAWIPNPEGDKLIDGCVWPLGEGIEDTTVKSIWHSSLDRNQYVIYNKRRVIPKYLVQVEFTDKPL